MPSYQGVKLYTAQEVMSRASVKFSKKTFEFMRDTLRFLPKPIKIADKRGLGTVGYYPEHLEPFLKKIEKEHHKGKSYPQIARELAAEGEVVRHLAEKLQRAYNSEKAVGQEISKGWKVEIEPALGTKRADMAIRLSSGERIFVEVKRRGNEHDISLHRWDGKNYQELNVSSKDKELQQLQEIILDAQKKLAGFFEQKKSR